MGFGKGLATFIVLGLLAGAVYGLAMTFTYLPWNPATQVSSGLFSAASLALFLNLIGLYTRPKYFGFLALIISGFLLAYGVIMFLSGGESLFAGKISDYQMPAGIAAGGGALILAISLGTGTRKL